VIHVWPFVGSCWKRGLKSWDEEIFNILTILGWSNFPAVQNMSAQQRRVVLAFRHMTIWRVTISGWTWQHETSSVKSEQQPLHVMVLSGTFATKSQPRSLRPMEKRRSTICIGVAAVTLSAFSKAYLVIKPRQAWKLKMKPRYQRWPSCQLQPFHHNLLRSNEYQW